MALEEDQARWLNRFTGGAIPLPNNVAAPVGAQALKDQLENLQAQEWAEEQALKTVLLTRAFAVIDKEKEAMRANFDLQVETYDDPDAPDVDVVDDSGKPTGKTQKKSGVTQQVVRDEQGRQERAYDAMESTRLKSAAKGRTNKDLTATDATKAMSVLVGEKDKLAAQTTRRSRIDVKSAAIVQVVENLFTDKELMDELYTPLVRDLVVPETFVPNKYSATQKMIDGTNDYYLKECKSKGAPMPTGAAAFAKGAIELGSQVAGTILGGLAAVKEGQQAMSASGTLSKEDATKATDITNGIAALLTGTVDVVDQVQDFRNSGDVSSAGFNTIANKLATSLGKIVAGATGGETGMALGMVVTDTISGAASIAQIGIEVKVWKDKGGQFPIAKIVSLVGDAVSKGLSAASDQTSDTNEDGSDNGKVSTHFAQASQAAKTAFEAAARAAEGKLLKEIKAGNWGAVYDFIGSTAADVGKQLPLQLVLDERYNEQSDYEEQHKVAEGMEQVDKIGDAGEGLKDLLEEGGKAARDKLARKGVKLPDVPQTPQQKKMAEIEKAFKAKEEELARKAEEASKDDVAAIETQMKKEQEAFTKSLVCLGSEKPDDSEFKSIAKLVEQLERDRKIWDGLFALFGGGIGAASGMAVAMGVAAEVAPPLKIAGQLVKYCMNLKAAADRCVAWLTWREGRKDAESAVSPYATSIDNFTKNQGQQFSHYSVQAAANAIQALLACGEMSPLAPAFKAAGGGVAAAAAAEDLIYRFYKQRVLANAWKMTRQALDPKNYGNRKMALLVRQVNPTLAKYTVAYGALVEESPVAITACNRIGLDRETLARSSDKVSDLKDYFEKLYPDDGIVVGLLEASPGKTKVPPPALETKAWALSMMLWTDEHGLRKGEGPTVVSHLSIVEARLKMTRRNDDQNDQLVASLEMLVSAFTTFRAETDGGQAIPVIQAAVAQYADLAEAKLAAVKMDIEAAANA